MKLLQSKIALTIASLCVALLIAEVAIRLFHLAPDYKFYPGPLIAQDDYDYTLRPNHRGHQGDVPVWTDARGMRIATTGDEARGKIENAYRVLILGDSLPFGWGVPYEDTFVFLLKQEIRKDRPNAAVWNASVPGYSTWHEHLYLKSHVDKLQPNLVILCLFANDYVQREWIANKGGTLTKRGMENMRGDLSEFLFKNPFFSRHSGMYRVIKNAARDYLYHRHDSKRSAAVFSLLVPSAHAEQVASSPWHTCYTLIEQIRAILGERDIGFHILDLTEDARVWKYLKTRYAVTRYVEHDKDGNTLPKDSHPNANGHRLIFRALHADVAKLGGVE